MATIELQVIDIPLEQLTRAEEFALQSLQMSKERVLGRYADQYNETLERCYKDVTCPGMFKGIPVTAKNDDEIHLEGGIVLKSKTLAKMLHRADEVVAYAVTLIGHDELLNDPDNSMLEGMFYNAWGAGFSMAGHRWLKKIIAEQASERGRYAGRGWTTGEDDVELRLQEQLFQMIDPSQIGLSVEDSGIMHPVMSVSGFMGISDDPAIVEDGADKGECH